VNKFSLSLVLINVIIKLSDKFSFAENLTGSTFTMDHQKMQEWTFMTLFKIMFDFDKNKTRCEWTYHDKISKSIVETKCQLEVLCMKDLVRERVQVIYILLLHNNSEETNKERQFVALILKCWRTNTQREARINSTKHKREGSVKIKSRITSFSLYSECMLVLHEISCNWC